MSGMRPEDFITPYALGPTYGYGQHGQPIINGPFYPPGPILTPPPVTTFQTAPSTTIPHPLPPWRDAQVHAHIQYSHSPRPTSSQPRNDALNAPANQSVGDVAGSQQVKRALPTDVAKPSRRGNNKYGLKGTKKCSRCRKNSHRCVFKDPDLPCDGCIKASLDPTSCEKLSAAEYKAQTSIPSTTPMVEDVPEPTLFQHLVYGIEAHYLGTYRDLWGRAVLGPRRFQPRFESTASVIILNIEYILPTSGVHKSAVLALMSKMYPCVNDDDDARSHQRQYIERFHSVAKTAKAASDYLSCAGGYYVMTQSSFINGECISESFPYYEAFCEAFKALKASDTADYDHLTIVEGLWQHILGGLFGFLRHNLRMPQPQVVSYYQILSEVLATLDRWSDLLVSFRELNSYPLSMNSTVLSQKVVSLTTYLQLYLELYLFLQPQIWNEAVSKQTAHIREQLVDMSPRLCRAISHLHVTDYIHEIYHLAIEMEKEPNFIRSFDTPELLYQRLGYEPPLRDTALALVYYFARILPAIFRDTEEQERRSRHVVRRFARAIYILCICLPSDEEYEPTVTYLKARSLFYASSILTESVDQAANSKIITTLGECVRSGYNWSLCKDFDVDAALQKFTAFFAMTKKSMKTSEIWRSPEFFEINTYLPPWSYGLHLVRYEARRPFHKKLTLIRS